MGMGGFWGNYCDKECDCRACDLIIGCPVAGESKQEGQMFFFQILFLSAK